MTESNRNRNDSYETYLAAKKISTKAEAEKMFQTFNEEYEKMYVWYSENIRTKTDVSEEITKEGLSRSLTILEQLRDVLHGVSTVLENSVTASNFSQSDLRVLQTKTTELLSSLELAILDQNGGGIKGSISAL